MHPVSVASALPRADHQIEGKRRKAGLRYLVMRVVTKTPKPKSKRALEKLNTRQR